MNSKIRTLLFAVSLMLVAASCDKTKHKMEIIKDCETIYLRDKNGQDYKVCNDEILESYAAGTKVKVSFDNMEQCFGLIEDPACEAAHLIQGVIEVTEIH